MSEKLYQLWEACDVFNPHWVNVKDYGLKPVLEETLAQQWGISWVGEDDDVQMYLPSFVERSK